MVEAVKNNAIASGHAGVPPITTIELMENSKTAQSSTRLSTNIEKLRSDRVNQPQAIPGDGSSAMAVGSSSTRIADRGMEEKVSSLSSGANIESRPVSTAAENIWLSSQSRSARRARVVRST